MIPLLGVLLSNFSTDLPHAELEYLGPPGRNQPQQAQIQALYANIATVIYSYKNSFQHYLRVRCDDPNKSCNNYKNPCNPK